MDKKGLEKLPVLDDGQVYIYVLLNSPAGNIKIGKTTNLQQRIKSLSGSNGAGMQIVEYYCSPATYISKIEKICHNKFNYARLKGEWFDGTKIEFDEVVEYLKSLFASKDYERCNELRKQRQEQKETDYD